MTPTESAFLKAILATPDDDSPRLVYADWLEEHAGGGPCRACNGQGGLMAYKGHGDVDSSVCNLCSGTGRVSDGRAERAEFIRVQCELARLPPEPPKHRHDCKPPRGSVLCARCEWLLTHGEKAEALRRREWELWDALPAEAFGVPEGLMIAIRESGWERGTWGLVRRGFVEHVTCTASDWLAHGPAVVACQPVREVRLTGRLYPVQNHALVSLCLRLREVHVCCELDEELGWGILKSTFSHLCPEVKVVYQGVSYHAHSRDGSHATPQALPT